MVRSPMSIAGALQNRTSACLGGNSEVEDSYQMMGVPAAQRD
jgi:hypothetical protein